MSKRYLVKGDVIHLYSPWVAAIFALHGCTIIAQKSPEHTYWLWTANDDHAMAARVCWMSEFYLDFTDQQNQEVEDVMQRIIASMPDRSIRRKR